MTTTPKAPAMPWSSRAAGAGSMWGVEHTAMAIVAGGLCLWFAARRNWSWLGAALLSQVPFWCGTSVYWISGNDAPANVNMALNLIVAGAFSSWAHRLQESGLGGIVHIWVCLVFLGACSLDVVQSIAPFSWYIVGQEAAHYLALIVIGGRAYVRGLDGVHRDLRDSRNSPQGGRLV